MNSHYQVKEGCLHLRKLGLEHAELLDLLETVKNMLHNEDKTLTSFSLSYNLKLRDDGVIKLLRVLTPNIQSLGLVDCDMGDVGGESLLRWSASNFDLQMLCIEGNNLSAQLKNRFIELSKKMNFQFFG